VSIGGAIEWHLQEDVQEGSADDRGHGNCALDEELCYVCAFEGKQRSENERGDKIPRLY